MWASFILLGDKTDHGGTVTSASVTTDVEGKGIARVGDTVICPKCKRITRIITGDPTNLIDGLPAAIHGSKTDCGATLISSQATAGISTGEPKQAATNLNDIATTLVTFSSVSKAVISAAAVPVSASSGQNSIPASSSSQSYPRVEEGEEEEEVGETEMGPNGPLDHPYELLIRVMEMEVEKQKAVLGAADLAENADVLLSVVEIARPRGVIRMVNAAGAQFIESSLQKGTSVLRDAGVNAVSADMDRAKMHLRRSIKRLEDQIEQARRIVEGRKVGTEAFDEFQAAREREVLERHLNDAFNQYYSEIKEDENAAKKAANSKKEFSEEKYNELGEYQSLYSSNKAKYDKRTYDLLELEAVNAHDSWKVAEGRLKEAELAASELDDNKKTFLSGSAEEKIVIVEKLQKAVIRNRLKVENTDNPFGK